MDALIAIAKRRSVRMFDSKPVDKGTLERIVDAGRLAATAKNDQPWEFIVVTDRVQLHKLADATDYGKFLAGAGACIAVVCRETKYYLEDGCAATQNILVAATALGVHSCWIAGEKKAYALNILKLLNVPPHFNLVSIVALGYAKGKVKDVPKRDLDKVLHWETF